MDTLTSLWTDNCSSTQLFPSSQVHYCRKQTRALNSALRTLGISWTKVKNVAATCIFICTEETHCLVRLGRRKQTIVWTRFQNCPFLSTSSMVHGYMRMQESMGYARRTWKEIRESFVFSSHAITFAISGVSRATRCNEQTWHWPHALMNSAEQEYNYLPPLPVQHITTWSWASAPVLLLTFLESISVFFLAPCSTHPEQSIAGSTFDNDCKEQIAKGWSRISVQKVE